MTVTPIRPGLPIRSTTTMKPMKLKTATMTDVPAYIQDNAWVAEQKVDGTRCVITVHPDGVVEFTSGNGGALKHSTSVKHFPALRRALRPLPNGAVYAIDGELLWTGEFYAFDLVRLDVPGVNAADPLHCSLAARRQTLESLLDHAIIDADGPVRLLPQARTADEKATLFRKVYDAGGEGVVLKHADGGYVPGTRSAEQLKVKFRKTVDCIVTARNVRVRSNAELAVYDDGQLRSIGSCSMIGKPDAQPGDVVEVAYLYATDAFVLYQPSLARIRDDKPADECTIDQLVPVCKDVLALT